MRRLSAFLFLAAQCWSQSLNPTGSLAVHDPSEIIKEGSTYYLFYTGNLIPYKTSPNMIAWTAAGSALASRPSWHATSVPNNKSGDIWAPTISYRNGQYWMYYSVSSFGSQTSAIGLATRTSLATGSWQDQGVVITSPIAAAGNFNAIDPNIITDTLGNVWMAWGSFWNGIFITQLNPQTGKPPAALTSANTTNIAKRTNTANGIEGSFIIYARGYYHLFISWDKCCAGTSSTYNMRYGRSKSVTGPYVDKAGLDLATGGGGTLLSDGSGSPGGGQSVYQENGNFYLVYHVYDGKNTPASLQIRHLYFDSQAWPTLDPAQSVSIQTEKRLNRMAAPVWSDAFSIPWGTATRNALGRIKSEIPQVRK